MENGPSRYVVKAARCLHSSWTPAIKPVTIIGLVVCAIGVGFSLDLLVQGTSTPHWSAVDFGHMYAAAEAILRGRQPYRAGYVNLPSLAVIAILFTLAPPGIAYSLFALLTVAAVGISSARLAASLGWSRPTLVAAAVVTSWASAFGLYVGKPEGLLFADAVLVVALARRGSMFWAGVAAGALMTKPTVTWPIPIFLLLAIWSQRGAVDRYARGLVLSTAIFTALGAWLLPSWFHATVSFAGRVGGQQTILSLDGLLRMLPASWHLGVGLLSPGSLALLALGMGLLAWLARAILSAAPSQDRALVLDWAVWLPLAVWLATTPYDHSYDELFVVPLILLVAGTNGERLAESWVALAIVAAAVLPATGTVGLFLPGPSLAPLALAWIVALGFLAFRSKLPRPSLGSTLPSQRRRPAAKGT